MLNRLWSERSASEPNAGSSGCGKYERGHPGVAVGEERLSKLLVSASGSHVLSNVKYVLNQLSHLKLLFMTP